MMSDDHAAWSELAAGYAMSSLDDADQAMYLEHAALCATCRELEYELSGVLADLALATAPVAPPPSLKASIMRVIHDDDSRQAPVIPLAARHSVIDLTGAGTSTVVAPLATRKARRVPQWIVAVAASVIGAALVAVWLAPRHTQASIAERCAAVNCPVITLSGSGQPVGQVMVLDNVVYLDAHGLPPTPQGDVYVLWALPGSGKAPVGLAALHTVPTSGPVRAATFTAPLGNGSGFAVSEERGDSVPSAPTKVLAQGIGA
jgi:hypothetical protein